ncbi:hypothetical protein BAU01nite_34690 [Brevibacterium aurantiacum]|nr:hypothetical protein BAU01nite_34690 [Brevibacterium aurantiacum]
MPLRSDTDDLGIGWTAAVTENTHLNTVCISGVVGVRAARALPGIRSMQVLPPGPAAIRVSSDLELDPNVVVECDSYDIR